MRNPMLEKWEPAAWGLAVELPRVAVPLAVLTGEAVDVARFFQTHYRTKLDADGRVVKRGLDLAVGGGQFRPELGREILELQEATQAAQTEHVMTVAAPESPTQRGEFVLGELVAGLEFLLDDGVDDEDDLRIARLAKTHKKPTSQDKLAAALSDYAGMAETQRPRLAKLKAFNLDLIAEAVSLAAKLRDQSAEKLTGSVVEQRQRALELRNRLASMLYERMKLVRSAARYVFRHDPDTVKRATSGYQRQRVARYRRGRKKRG